MQDCSLPLYEAKNYFEPDPRLACPFLEVFFLPVISLR